MGAPAAILQMKNPGPDSMLRLSTTRRTGRRIAAMTTGPNAPAEGQDPQQHLDQPHLEALIQEAHQLAARLEGNPEELLTLLRELETLHRSIQEGQFRRSLPEDRQQLFALLKDMERSGGWPYIPRLQLRTFMDLLQRNDRPAPEQEPPLAA